MPLAVWRMTFFFLLLKKVVMTKTMENFRKRIISRSINNAKSYKKICEQTMFCFTRNT